MDNIFQLLQSQITPQVISTLSKQIRADEATTAAATQGAISAIVGALSKEAASPQKAMSLLGALDRDHDGSVLNDIVGILSGAASPGNSRTTNGLGILDHLLGGNVNNIIAMLSKGTGLDFLKTGTLLKLLAPIVMGGLGKARAQNEVNQNNVFDFLNKSIQKEAPKRQELDIFKRILDADGDGSIMDEVGGMGMKVLGGLLRRR